MSKEDIIKYVNEKISEALTGSFEDATNYGVGYIRISINGVDGVTVEHVPFTEMDKEIEKIAEHKKYIV